MSPTIAELIADYVTGLRFGDVPAPAIERAKELLLFNLGAAVCGWTTRIGPLAVRAALELSSGGPCSIVGERRTASLLEAVYANSALMDAALIKDILEPSGTVPGHTVHPAAWALGEWTEVSGRQLLTAVVAGYDVMAKLHSGVLDYDLPVPRPTKAVVQPFGVAAAAASLLDLSREQTTSAMGLAGQFVMGTYEGMEDAAMHPLVARNGVLAAMLAKAGMPGARTIVEGPYGVYRSFFLQDVPESVHANLATLGTDFEILKAHTSPYPVSHTNAMPIELTMRLAQEHELVPERLAAVHVVLPQSREARETIYGTYEKGPDTVVAIALTDRRFDPARFDEELGPDVLAARDKVRLEYEDGRDFFYARVELETVDGRRYVAEGDGLKDGPALDESTWRTVAGDGLDDATATRLEELIRNLDDVADVHEVTACFAKLVPEADSNRDIAGT
jgi:2-methylcitrate dehydratase PrpD